MTKKIETTVKFSHEDGVIAALEQIGVIAWWTLEAKTFGYGKEPTDFFGGKEYTVQQIIRTKIEVVCVDDLVETVVEVFTKAAGGVNPTAKGMITVTSIDQAIDISDASATRSQALPAGPAKAWAKYSQPES